VVGLGRF